MQVFCHELDIYFKGYKNISYSLPLIFNIFFYAKICFWMFIFLYFKNGKNLLLSFLHFVTITKLNFSERSNNPTRTENEMRMYIKYYYGNKNITLFINRSESCFSLLHWITQTRFRPLLNRTKGFWLSSPRSRLQGSCLHISHTRGFNVPIRFALR